jgi:hypothetical protein
MKISILTTITNPLERQDRYKEALRCYEDMADEVVVVDGTDLARDGQTMWISEKILKVYLTWPYEWNWVELPKHLNEGLKYCSGDWVIKLDIDQFFHERDKDLIKTRLEMALERDCIVATFEKFTVYSSTKGFQKGKMPIAINRNYKNVLFGLDNLSESDLCSPIIFRQMKKVNGYELPMGKLIQLGVFNTILRFYNYDYFFKDLDVSLKEIDRFSRAYDRFFHKKYMGSGDFLSLRKGYSKKHSYNMTLDDHPKYIREAVKEVIDKKLKVVGNLDL